ncbi:MAG: bifunctional DNA primase/polymerase [Patescibacteria group bacterium]
MENENNMLEQALRCHALGFSVIPLREKDKMPLMAWKQYQKERASPDQIRAWFKQFPNMNIGVATGAISGVVVIDVEKGGSIGDLPITATAKTGGGGWHLYYKYPNRPIGNSTKKIAPLTDVKADGGIIVLPPSIHPSGNSYEWSIPPEEGFTDIPPELLERLIADAPTHSQQTDVDVLEGSRNDDATRYIGRILHHLPPDLWDTAGWASLKDRNDNLYKPRLDVNELRSVFTSIKQREYQSRGSGNVLTGQFVNFKPFTLTDLYQEKFPVEEWVVKDLIPLGTITALTGESNSYKTFFTQSMAASVNAGTPFLGHFPTRKGKVLVIDEENHRRHVKNRYETLGISATADILFLSQEGIRIDNEEHIKRLRELLDKEKPSLVILDSLVRLHSGEENSATEIARAFSGMRKLVDNDRAIIVIHHHRKPRTAGKKSNSQSIRGSSDILAAVDTHLAIDREETEITVTQSKMRLQPELSPFKANLVLSPEGGMSFVYQGVDTTEDDRLQEAYEAIKTALLESKEPLNIDMLADETELPIARIRQAKNDLLKSNEIVITKTGAHGAHFFGLPDATEQDKETLTTQQ